MILDVKFRAKFTNSSNQYYLYYIHYGNEDKGQLLQLTVAVKALFTPSIKELIGKKLYINNTTDHTGHAKYTEMELLNMMKLNDVLEYIKTRAQRLFENGKTCIGINSTLQKEFSQNK